MVAAPKTWTPEEAQRQGWPFPAANPKAEDEVVPPDALRRLEAMPEPEEPRRAAVDAPLDAETLRTILGELARLRSQLGTRLIALTEHAFTSALSQAGVKLTSRARSRQSAARQAQVAKALEEHAPLGALLAAVGIQDYELLDHAFDSYRARVEKELAAHRARVERLLAKYGQAQITLPEHQGDAAVQYLVASLTALARARLLRGPEALTAATRPDIPRAPRMTPEAQQRYESFFSTLPSPEELDAAAARLVRNAVSVAEGRTSMSLPTTPDRMPVTAILDTPTVEEQLMTSLEVEPLWEWVHGFYGEPLTGDFDAHLALDGFVTRDRYGDPELDNGGDWTEGDFYQPDDHAGCTCEWVPALLEEGQGEGEGEGAPSEGGLGVEFFPATDDLLDELRDLSAMPLGAESTEPSVAEGMVRLYHGTTKGNAEAIRAEGFQPLDARGIADAVGSKYGVPGEDIYGHPWYEFARARTERQDPSIYFSTDRAIAESYAESRSETVTDALTTVYRIQHGPDIQRGQATAWAKAEAAKWDRPAVLGLDVPRATVPNIDVIQEIEPGATITVQLTPEQIAALRRRA